MPQLLQSFHIRLAFISIIMLQCILDVRCINHWVLKEDGRIGAKIDSPFLMREPHNLVAFLEQIRNNDYVEQSYLKLRRQRELIAEHLRYSKEFSEDLVTQAERLQPLLGPQTQPVLNLINSLLELTEKTAKMYSYLEFVKDELKEFRKLKSLITQHHEKLIQQQVPLAIRQVEGKVSSDDLLKRGQYCSTRTLSATEEPVLFCDFYSDMQMRLEGKDVDAETLERDWQLTSESVLNQVTNLNVQQRMNLEKIKAARGIKSGTSKQASAEKVTTTVVTGGVNKGKDT